MKIVASVAAVATVAPVGIGALEREARRHDPRPPPRRRRPARRRQPRAAGRPAETPAADPARVRRHPSRHRAGGRRRPGRERDAKPSAPAARKDARPATVATSWEPRSLRTRERTGPPGRRRTNSASRPVRRRPWSGAARAQGGRSTGNVGPIRATRDERGRRPREGRGRVPGGGRHEQSPKPETTEESVPAPADTHTHRRPTLSPATTPDQPRCPARDRRRHPAGAAGHCRRGGSRRLTAVASRAA